MTSHTITAADAPAFIEQLEDYLNFERRLAPSTIAWNIRIIRRLMKVYGSIAPGRDFARQLEQDLRREGKKTSTISRYLGVIQRLYEFQHQGQKLRLRLPKETSHVVDYLTVDELRRISRACQTQRDRAIVAVLATTGLRNKELCSLNLDDVDLRNRIIYVRDHGQGIKTHQESTVAMTVECAEALRTYLECERPDVQTRAVFVSYTLNNSQRRKNPRLTQKGVLLLVKRLGSRAGLERRMWAHLFRHTTGTMMAANGINIALVQRQLRHRDIQSTMIYVTQNVELVRQNLDEHLCYGLQG